MQLLVNMTQCCQPQMIVHGELCRLAQHLCYRSWHRTMLFHRAMQNYVSADSAESRVYQPVLIEQSTNGTCMQVTSSTTYLRELDSVLVLYNHVMRIVDDGLRVERITLYVVGGERTLPLSNCHFSVLIIVIFA